MLDQPSMSIPVLETPRLVLRPYTRADAPVVQRLAGVPEVALTTLNIPYPYEDGVAEAWIASHEEGWAARRFLTLAITTLGDGVVGTVTLHLTQTHRRGELGYWVGTPYWNRGYATEASAALIEYGFSQLDLHRIQARHLIRNPASGRVMEKLHMTFEGIHRHQMLVRDTFEDLAMFAILRTDRAR